MKIFILPILCLIINTALVIAALKLFSSYKPSKTINQNAPVKTKQKISIYALPDKIWAIISEINHWTRWHSDVQHPVLNGAFQPGTSFDWKTGGLNIHSTLHTAKPYSSIGWSGKAFGSFAIHNWTFTQMPGYTEVSVDEIKEGRMVS